MAIVTEPNKRHDAITDVALDADTFILTIKFADPLAARAYYRKARELLEANETWGIDIYPGFIPKH